MNPVPDEYVSSCGDFVKCMQKILVPFGITVSLKSIDTHLHTEIEFNHSWHGVEATFIKFVNRYEIQDIRFAEYLAIDVLVMFARRNLK